jgi:hypothetical protein
VTALTVLVVALCAKAARVCARLAAFDAKPPAVDIMGNCDRHRRSPPGLRQTCINQIMRPNSQNMQPIRRSLSPGGVGITAVPIGRYYPAVPNAGRVERLKRGGPIMRVNIGSGGHGAPGLLGNLALWRGIRLRYSHLVTDPTEPPVNAEAAALRPSAATRTDARKLSAPHQNCA